MSCLLGRRPSEMELFGWQCQVALKYPTDDIHLEDNISASELARYCLFFTYIYSEIEYGNFLPEHLRDLRASIPKTY